jgi:hypothetical protein
MYYQVLEPIIFINPCLINDFNYLIFILLILIECFNSTAHLNKSNITDYISTTSKIFNHKIKMNYKRKSQTSKAT